MPSSPKSSTSKDWCPIRALLVIAQAQKPGATHNKGGLQFGNTNKGKAETVKKGGTPTQAGKYCFNLFSGYPAWLLLFLFASYGVA